MHIYWVCQYVSISGILLWYQEILLDKLAQAVNRITHYPQVVLQLTLWRHSPTVWQWTRTMWLQCLVPCLHRLRWIPISCPPWMKSCCRRRTARNQMATRAAAARCWLQPRKLRTPCSQCSHRPQTQHPAYFSAIPNRCQRHRNIAFAASVVQKTAANISTSGTVFFFISLLSVSPIIRTVTVCHGFCMQYNFSSLVFLQFLPAQRSKRGNSYGNVAGWLAVPHRYSIKTTKPVLKTFLIVNLNKIVKI